MSKLESHAPSRSGSAPGTWSARSLLACGALFGAFAPVARAGLSVPGVPVAAVASNAVAYAVPIECDEDELVAAPPVLPPELEGADVARLWRFDVDGDAEGWEAAQGCAPLEAHDGELVVRTLAADPFVCGPGLSVDASAYPFLAFRCRSTADGQTQVYYSRSDAPGFREAQMFEVPTHGDGRWHVYQVDLRPVRNWSGVLDRLRFDPVNGLYEANATVEFDWVALYQTPARVTPLLPHWKDDATLVLGFENRGGQDACANVRLTWDGLLVGELPCLASAERAEIEIDAHALPAQFWIEAALGDERIWRGRMVRPVLPEPERVRAVDADVLEERAGIAIGSGTGVLAHGAALRVRLAPIASLTVRGPGRALSYYEFDVSALPATGSEGEDALAPHVYQEWLNDPALGALLCTTSVLGTTVRTAIESTAPLDVLRFEGPRMLEERRHSHALLPGLEYLDRGEESSRDCYTGPHEADRSTPAPYKITVPMIAVEYDRPEHARAPAPVVRGVVEASARRDTVRAMSASADSLVALESPRSVPPGTSRDVPGGAWVAAVAWDIGNREHLSAGPPNGEFVSHDGRFSYATVFLPSPGENVEENSRYAARPLALPAYERLELESSFSISPGTIEDVFSEYWTRTPPQPPGLDWAAEDERVPEEKRAGPGSRAALEHIVATSMLAYTETLFDAVSSGWKTHIAIGEAYAPRVKLAAIVLGESLRSGKPEYAAKIGLAPDAQIEDRIGTAAALVDDVKRRAACDALARMGQDGGVGYLLTPEMKQKIREFTAFYGLHYDTFGEPGATNSGMIALAIEPLLEYAACSRDPLFVEAGELALARMNSFTVPRGAQIWEIHMDTPDLYAAAHCVTANLWGWRITGDERYLDEALRWARTGVPFLYLWEPPDSRRVRSVLVADQAGEGPVLAPRDPGIFYVDTNRQINPYASIPVFGTSWFAVTWLGIPVQWCGLAWANAVRELDALRSVPKLVRLADGIFRSGANQQCDGSYLAGTMPDSWEVAGGLSRQPYIIPERLLEYAYRQLGAPYLDAIQYVRLDLARWTHVASRALLAHVDASSDRVAFDARFFRGQNASVLVGGNAADRAGDTVAVRVNGRELEHGDAPWQEHWRAWNDTRGALVVRWVATGGDDHVEIVARH